MLTAVYARTTKDGKDVIETYERKQDRGFIDNCEKISKEYGHTFCKADIFNTLDEAEIWINKLPKKWHEAYKTYKDEKAAGSNSADKKTSQAA